jgi:hypothetical protein
MCLKEWPPRENSDPVVNNVQNAPVVNTEMALLPPLHMKLKLEKDFVKAF